MMTQLWRRTGPSGCGFPSLLDKQLRQGVLEDRAAFLLPTAGGSAPHENKSENSSGFLTCPGEQRYSGTAQAAPG